MGRLLGLLPCKATYSAVITEVLLSIKNLLVSLSSLILVLGDVLLLKLSHSLDFIQVYYEALIVGVLDLDALSAENAQVIGAIKVLYTLGVKLTQFV